MFQRIADFCRRLFSNKGFRRGLNIACWVFIALQLIGLIHYFAVLMKTGVPFGFALRFLLFIPFYLGDWVLASASVVLGIAAGLVWYFHRKKKDNEEAEPEEKAEESSDAVQEEEIIETTHYMFH